MSLKRFFILSLLSCFALSVFSCNDVEEETNVKFEWNYVKRKLQVDGTDSSWVIDTSEKFVVDEYIIKYDSNVMEIMGTTTSDDSIYMRLENNESGKIGSAGKVITAGEYPFGGSNKYNLEFFKDQQILTAESGHTTIDYINSRVDFHFFTRLNNNYYLENGIAENLDVYQDTIIVK